jgi:hypothetical protein
VHAGLVCLNVAPGLMSLDEQKRFPQRQLSWPVSDNYLGR